MPAGQQIAFEPALTKMLAQHLHHAAVGREMVVIRNVSAAQARFVTSRHPASDSSCFVRAEQAKITRSRLSFMTSRRNGP